MYYNYTDEEKYFLSVTDAMLKDDYSVEEIVEFWISEDQDQVEGILGSLTLTESVDYGNPKLAVVCERFGLGTAWGWIRRGAGALGKAFKKKPPVQGPKPKPKGPIEAAKNKIQHGASVAKANVKSNVKKLPPGVKGAALVAGGSYLALKGQDVADDIANNNNQQQQQNPPGDGPKDPGVLAPGANASVEPKKSYGWWKKYPKMDDYSSSKQYYQNIFKK